MLLTKIIKWECYAQTSQRRDNLSMKAKRVEHLQIEIVVGSIEMVTQILNPLKSWGRGNPPVVALLRYQLEFVEIFLNQATHKTFAELFAL